MSKMDRIRRGAALLDARFPGWEHKVDLARLDQLSSDSCVLGQVVRAHGHPDAEYWLHVRRVVGLSHGEAVDLGFDGSDYQEMTDLWKAVINERLVTAPASATQLFSLWIDGELVGHMTQTLVQETISRMRTGEFKIKEFTG